MLECALVYLMVVVEGRTIGPPGAGRPAGVDDEEARTTIAPGGSGPSRRHRDEGHRYVRRDRARNGRSGRSSGPSVSGVSGAGQAKKWEARNFFGTKSGPMSPIASFGEFDRPVASHSVGTS